jgi:hypothetical protein
MERSRHASHLASRSYRGGIPDLGGGGDEVAGAGAGGGGAGVAVGAAVSGASAMARVSRHEGRRGRRDSGEAETTTARGGVAALVVASALPDGLRMLPCVGGAFWAGCGAKAICNGPGQKWLSGHSPLGLVSLQPGDNAIASLIHYARAKKKTPVIHTFALIFI